MAFIQSVGYGTGILLQSKLELFTAPTSVSLSGRRWAEALLEFEAIRSWIENVLGSQCQDPTLNLSWITSPLYSDRRNHLEHYLITLILAVHQVEANMARLCAFLQYFFFFLLQVTYCFQKLQLHHENTYLQAYEMLKNNQAHIRKKTSDINKTTQKATEDWSTF